tara:strand:+ start:148 stop:537 length:390 start_codon:yes stop_codon:yes gene_type:complete
MTDDLNDKKLLKNLLKAVKELTKVLKKTGLTKNFQDSNNLKKFSSKRVQIKHDDAITSPMVGTVYLSPEPKANAFIKQGQIIKKGDTLLIIEAMKTFNPIKSEKSGKVEKILVNDAEPVEFGQPLVVIK